MNTNQKIILEKIKTKPNYLNKLKNIKDKSFLNNIEFATKAIIINQKAYQVLPDNIKKDERILNLLINTLTIENNEVLRYVTTDNDNIKKQVFKMITNINYLKFFIDKILKNYEEEFQYLIIVKEEIQNEKIIDLEQNDKFISIKKAIDTVLEKDKENKMLKDIYSFDNDEKKRTIKEIVDKYQISNRRLDDIKSRFERNVQIEIYRIYLKKIRIELEKRGVKADHLIEELNFTPRILNALKRAGLNTAEKISTKTEKEILDINGIGEKNKNEIIDKLSEKHMSLKSDEKKLRYFRKTM